MSTSETTTRSSPLFFDTPRNDCPSLRNRRLRETDQPKRRSRPRLLLRALAGTAALLCAGHLAGQPSATTEQNPLQQVLPELMENAGSPGASAAWVKGGRVAWTGAFGVTDAGTGAPVVADTIFEAASLSKPVVAFIAMRLASRGVLDLDAPLWGSAEGEGYERLAHDERARRITARMVLSHTSGLPNWGGTPLEMNSDPGTAWNYSGEGFV